jgi:hypothetical protein
MSINTHIANVELAVRDELPRGANAGARRLHPEGEAHA